MPKHTTPHEDGIYAGCDPEVQAIIDKLDKMIDERDDEISYLRNELASLRIDKDEEIAGLKEELRNQSE